jgi:hypothetical protein
MPSDGHCFSFKQWKYSETCILLTVGYKNAVYISQEVSGPIFMVFVQNLMCTHSSLLSDIVGIDT